MFPTLIALQLDLKTQAVKQQIPFIQTGEGGFGVFVGNMLTALMAVAALTVLIFLLWGAFDYINSSGEKSKIDSARNKMTGAVMGMIVLACVLVIFSFIQQILGIQIINFTGKAAPTQQYDPLTMPVGPGAGTGNL